MDSSISRPLFNQLSSAVYVEKQETTWSFVQQDFSRQCNFPYYQTDFTVESLFQNDASFIKNSPGNYSYMLYYARWTCKKERPYQENSASISLPTKLVKIIIRLIQEWHKPERPVCDEFAVHVLGPEILDKLVKLEDIPIFIE